MFWKWGRGEECEGTRSRAGAGVSYARGGAGAGAVADHDVSALAWGSESCSWTSVPPALSVQPVCGKERGRSVPGLSVARGIGNSPRCTCRCTWTATPRECQTNRPSRSPLSVIIAKFVALGGEIDAHIPWPAVRCEAGPRFLLPVGLEVSPHPSSWPLFNQPPSSVEGTENAKPPLRHRQRPQCLAPHGTVPPGDCRCAALSSQPPALNTPSVSEPCSRRRTTSPTFSTGAPPTTPACRSLSVPSLSTRCHY